MALYLLAGTPGQSKAVAAEKIATFLKKQGLSVGKPADVEVELLDLFSEYKDTDTSFQEPRVALIGERAQDEIKEAWPKAYESAVAKATSGSPDVAIVLLCFEYYRYETYEFYSPVDCNAIRDSKPKSALTLIDDIFDIYYRLSQPGQVFDVQELVDRTFPVSKTRGRDPKDLRRPYKDALEVTIGSFLRLLTWREKEIECAANVSRTIGCEHSVLAAKHPVEAGARFLLGSTTADFEKLGVSYPVYVSHPISRPRRDRASQDDWPPFVDNLDDVVARLRDKTVGNCHIVPVMPTAIDEFRILDDGTYLHPWLTPRWKLQNGELLFSLPQPPGNVKAFESYEDYESRGMHLIFDPPVDSSKRRVGLPLSDPEVSGMMRNLKESIRLQMAGRDHMLVRQCPGFFLYRPLCDEFEFSSGVTVEVHTFDQIRKYSSSVLGNRKRLVVFIHDETDASGLFSMKDDAHFPDPVHQASAALNSAASQLVEGSTGKTKRPRSPNDETVAQGLQVSGDPQDVAQEIHNQMFPPAPVKSVGSEQPLPWEKTGESLKRTLTLERVKALSCDIAQNVRYTASKSEPVWHFEDGEGESDTYVDVVEKLDEDQDRRAAAAKRAREFFSGAAGGKAEKGQSDLTEK